MKLTSVRTNQLTEIPAKDVKFLAAHPDGTLILRWSGGFIIVREKLDIVGCQTLCEAKENNNEKARKAS